MTVQERPKDSSRLRRIAYWLSAPLGAIASLATLAVMVAIVIDVISRNITGKSVPGLLEMSESALVAAVFLGLAYAGTTNSHVAVDILTSHINQTVARVLITLMWLAGIIVTTWFLISSTNRAIESFQRSESRTGLVDWPIWPARWIIVIGFAAFLIIALINVILLLRKEPILGEDILTAEEMAIQEAQQSDGLKGAQGGPENTSLNPEKRTDQ